MINILATPSNSYAMPCGITFYSACANNPKGSLHFYIVTDRLFTEDNKNKLRQTVEKYNNKIDFYTIDDKIVDKLSEVQGEYYPRYVYYRLFAFKFLPQDIHKIIYLDCDIIVRKPLGDLWNIDISSYGIAGVPDVTEGDITYYNRLEYSSEKGYFNAGVIFMNLDYWRNNNVESKLSEILTTKKDKLASYDQDVLNLVFVDAKKYIPIKYNVQSGFYYKSKYYGFELLKYKEDLEEGIYNPVILHLSGIRPWVEGCEKNHPFTSEFFKYKQQTVWKDTSLVTRREMFSTKKYLSIMLNAHIRKIASKLGLASDLPDKFDWTIQLKS